MSARPSSNRGQLSRQPANDQKGKISPQFRAGENLSPIKLPLTESEAIAGFRRAIEPYSEGELATAGKATKDAAKSWKRGDTMPRSVALINMSKTIPEVWEWIVHARGGQYNGNHEHVADVLREALRQVERRHD